jgi:cardiolipin synthase C
VVIHDARQATEVAAAIDTDLLPENSWNPAQEDVDEHASAGKRWKVRFWRILPLQPIL